MEEGVLTSEKKAEKKFNPEDRLKICQDCPLYDTSIGVCSGKIWMNPENGKVSPVALPGYAKGCGCLMSKKVRREGSHCHLGRW